MTALLLSSGFLAMAPAVAGATTDTTTTEPVKFGMEASKITQQTDAGVPPDYGTFWIGPWTLESGWGGPSKHLDRMYQAGVTPAIHYYYWGDDISPDCVENGCWSNLHNAWKDRAGWQQLAKELVAELNAHMKGEPVVILLETEFNKGGIENYEPFDGYLANKANFFEQNYPAAETTMPLGNWNSAAWSSFDQTAAAVDYVGIQGMRGSTRGTLDSYYKLYETTANAAEKLQNLFGKPVLIHDIALSTYPEPEYLEHQANELGDFFTGMDRLKQAGVMGLIYRSWVDAPNMDLNNYYGEAERHWGLAWAYSGDYKPAAKVWIDGVTAERDGTTSQPTGVPVGSDGASHEAEAFKTRTTGGLVSDSKASGGQAWNLWANGYIQETFEIEPGSYELSIRARGTPANGVGPRMEVTLGGEQVLASEIGTGYEELGATVDADGSTALRIAFTNDKLTSTEDRNLIVDVVGFAPTTTEPANTPPAASLQASCTDLTCRLDGSGSSDADGDALTYAWDLGDGTTASSGTLDHSYAADGTYTVTLTVTDPDGASDTAQQDVTVSAPAQGTPVDRSGTASIEAEEFATKTTGGEQWDNTASANHRWNLWTNGRIDQDLNVQEAGTYELRVRANGEELDGIPPHMVIKLDGTNVLETDVPGTGWNTYPVNLDLATGVHTLKIKFTNDGWASYADRNLLLDLVEIAPTSTNQPPSAAFTQDCTELSCTLDASGSSDPDGDALTYAWDLGDGTTATGAVVDHSYAAEGTYTVEVVVSDGSDEARRSSTVTVTEPNQPPSAAFTQDCTELSCTLDASGSSDPDGDALSYAWDLGDGTAATSAVVEHAYAEAGTYTVELVVSDGSDEARTSSTVTVTEANKAPTAAFTQDCTELSCTLDASGSSDPDGDALTYAWDLGDGNTATGAVVEHSYTAEGTYTVELTVDDGQASHSHAEAITVSVSQAELTADFRVSENVNEWWVEVYVDASRPLDGVEARVDDGPWRSLDATDWGSWAKSIRAPAGSSVTFRASAGEETVTSETYTWLGESSPELTATFELSENVNGWWVEVYVDASSTLDGVEARIDDGPWKSLKATDWGSWAKNMRVHDGSSVTFRATAGDQTAISDPYVWS